MARETQDPVSPDGEPLPPELPATAAALRYGVIGEHARTVVEGLRTVTPMLSPQQCHQAEALLVQQSRVWGPGEVRVLAEQVRYQVDPDGGFRDEDAQYDRGLFQEQLKRRPPHTL